MGTAGGREASCCAAVPNPVVRMMAFKAGENGHVIECHGVHRVDETGETVLGWVHEVVVQRQK